MAQAVMGVPAQAQQGSVNPSAAAEAESEESGVTRRARERSAQASQPE